MQLIPIPATHVDYAWRDGASKLAEACAASGGEVTGDQLKMLLARGERTLIRMVDNFTLGHLNENADGTSQNYETRTVGWGVIRIDQLPNVRALHVCEMYAPRANFERYFEELKRMAKQLGCSEVRCSAKEAQARLYKMKCGFEPIYTTMRAYI